MPWVYGVTARPASPSLQAGLNAYLIESREPTREGDVVLYDGEGTPVAYARPTR